MGEIRSTIDIMMERTKGMTLSDTEKEEVRLEELKKKARGYKTKLLESPSEVDQTLASLEKQSDKTSLEASLWLELVDALPTDYKAEQLLGILDKLPQASSKSATLEKARDLLKSSTKTRSQDRKKALTKEKKKLASSGISGTAVVPKLPKEGVPSAEVESQMANLKKSLSEGIRA